MTKPRKTIILALLIIGILLLFFVAKNFSDKIDSIGLKEEPAPVIDAPMYSISGEIVPENASELQKKTSITEEAFNQLQSEIEAASEEDTIDYQMLITDEEYDYRGDFENWGTWRNEEWYSQNNIQFDDNGIPLVLYNSELEFNPLTFLQYTLTVYGKYLKGQADKDEFLKLVDFAIEIMEEDGSYKYNYDFSYYLDPDRYYKAGWTSAMCNGHILSILARAYTLEPNNSYFAAAKKAISFLQVPIREGGVYTDLSELDSTLAGYNIMEEYPCEPNSYTLNGFMYTAIGLYDWSNIDSPTQDIAKRLFDESVETMKVLIPFYDTGNHTLYDLGYITFNNMHPHIAGLKYHAIHTAFCKNFYDITHDELFKYYYERFKSY